MLTANGLAIFVTMAVLGCTCIGADDLILAPGMTVQFTCTGPGLPTWHVNGGVAETKANCYRLTIRRTAGMNASAILTISGNQTCDTFNIYCGIVVSESQLLYARNLSQFSLVFQGHLLVPENLHINESVDSSNIGPVIEWTPPYSSLNSDIIHVDAHITQYTVYITDNYTGNVVVKVNVTETQFSFDNQGNVLCPMYQVSAWNAGGEGELSEPVQESTPRVPRNVIVKSITVRGTVTTNVVHIHINNVDVVCTSRIPEFFLITLMTSTGRVFNETRQHQPGQAVADFTISLPQSVDVCSLHVRISAGNSAGMSAPSEPVEVDCSGDSTDSTTTASATTVLTVTTSSGSGSEGGRQQGNIITTLIVPITIGVIAAVGVTLIVAVGIICCLKHKSKNSKDPADSVDNSNSESPSLGGPVQLYKPQIHEVLYEPTASRPIARDLQGTRELTQSSDSAESSHTTDSEGSSHSDDPLLQSRPLVYTQVNVQQTQVPPPANDDHVQYAQLKQQDKL